MPLSPLSGPIDIPKRKIRYLSLIPGLTSEVKARAVTNAAQEFRCRPPYVLSIIISLIFVTFFLLDSWKMVFYQDMLLAKVLIVITFLSL